MKPHAIFISLTDNYTHLFNALYNSAEFFGIGEYADFVVIHNDLPESYINFMTEKTQDRKTKIRFIQFTPDATDAVFGKVMNIKYHRYRIMAEIGKEYKSILFLDTDIFLVSNIFEYFEIAAKTDLIVGTNDQAVRYYRTKFEKGCCPAYNDSMTPVFDTETFDGKFICNVPTFIDVNKYGYVFEEVYKHMGKLGMDNSWPFTGDLDTMNIVFTKNDLKKKMLLLSANLWTGVHFSIYRSNMCVKRWMPGKNIRLTDPSYKTKFLFMNEACEHVRSFHGRDWTNEKSEEALKNGSVPKLLGQMEGNFSGEFFEKAKKKREAIFDLIQSCFLYFQFESYISLDELNSVIPVGGGRYEYMKEKQKKLDKTISTFRE
jgi:hypothetical protein